MDEWKIDATIDALRLEYEQTGSYVTYKGGRSIFGSDDAFEWWVYRLEQDLNESALV